MKCATANTQQSHGHQLDRATSEQRMTGRLNPCPNNSGKSITPSVTNLFQFTSVIGDGQLLSDYYTWYVSVADEENGTKFRVKHHVDVHEGACT